MPASSMRPGLRMGLLGDVYRNLLGRLFRREHLPVDRIGFLVHTAELLNHYGCVWDLMPNGSFDVILYGEAEHDPAIVARLAAWHCSVESATELLRSDSRYRYLVSNHPGDAGRVPLIKQLGKKNIRFMYAAGKSGWNLSDWNCLYDLIMCYGPYHAAAFARFTGVKTVEMGYPRFDRFFNDKPDLAALRQRYGCDPAKKNVVWLPTWKTLSSVGWFDAQISALSENYNVVVKLHPLMAGSEPDRVRAIEARRFAHVITDSSDNLPLYVLADFLLCDYGGPPLAGIYTDRNLLLLNVPGAEADGLMTGDSPDLTIREHIVNVNPDGTEIAGILRDDAIWEAQKPIRRMLREKYFAPYYGTSSKVAAETLANLDNILGERR